MKLYTPEPIDTDDVVLPEELTELAEEIAKNVHDVWSAKRLSEGWSYGEKRDDVKKTHPCLRPYDELPESEKAYDRATSMQTLKLIMKLGFNISKKRKISDSSLYRVVHSLLRKAVNAEHLYDKLKRRIPAVVEKHLPSELIRDEKGRVVNVLPENLDIAIADRIVADFKEVIAEEYSLSEHLRNLMSRIENMKASLETEETRSILAKFIEDLKKHARHYAEIQRPDFRLKELRKKYEDARRITVREHLMQDNNKDVADFAEALASYAADLCEVEVSLALARLYSDIAESPELTGILKG